MSQLCEIEARTLPVTSLGSLGGAPASVIGHFRVAAARPETAGGWPPPPISRAVIGRRRRDVTARGSRAGCGPALGLREAGLAAAADCAGPVDERHLRTVALRSSW